MLKNIFLILSDLSTISIVGSSGEPMSRSLFPTSYPQLNSKNPMDAINMYCLIFISPYTGCFKYTINPKDF